MKGILAMILFVTPTCLAANAPADPSPATGEAEFQHLFRNWQKGGGPHSSHVPQRSGPRLRPREEGWAISSPMGMRINPVTGRRMLHAGADLAAPWGADVRATADGVVVHAGAMGSYGLLVSICHPTGYETRYAHLSRIRVAPGKTIRKGDLIGHVGSTGRSTGPHLHYEIRNLGRAIDPLLSMRQ